MIQKTQTVNSFPDKYSAINILGYLFPSSHPTDQKQIQQQDFNFHQPQMQPELLINQQQQHLVDIKIKQQTVPKQINNLMNIYYTQKAALSVKMWNKATKTKEHIIFHKHIEQVYYTIRMACLLNNSPCSPRQKIKLNNLNPCNILCILLLFYYSFVLYTKSYIYFYRKQYSFIIKLVFKTIVLDLDETLIHSNGKTLNTVYTIRPYTQNFLLKLVNHFNLLIFTSSEEAYAKPIIDILDPNGDIFKKILYRNHCNLLQNQTCLKDLRILDIDLSKILIIDNTPSCFMFNIDNGVPIIPYINNQDDQELKYLLEFLLYEVQNSKDVRSVLQKKFKFNQFRNYNSADLAVQYLYG